MIGFSSSRTLAAAALVLVGASVHGQQPNDVVSVGQQICTAGYIMDEYCIVSTIQLIRAILFLW